MTKIMQLWARVQETRLWRTWVRFTDSRGSLLAGGVTYFAFFSIFPVIALAFTIFGIVLHDQPELLDQVGRSIDAALPGFIKRGDSGLIPIAVPSAATLTWTGGIAILALLWAGLGWLSALRTGIRGIFGVQGPPGNFVLAKLRDLGVLVIFGVAIVISAAATVLLSSAAGWFADLLGLSGQGWILRLVSGLLGLLLDTVIVLVMLRVLSGIAIPRRDLWGGALVGGVGLTVLKAAGTLLLGAVSNPLFASIGLVVGLLIWLNFIAKVVLLAAAWAATGTYQLPAQRSAAIDTSSGGPGDALRGAVGSAPTAGAAAHAGPAAEGTSPMPAAARAVRVEAGLPTFDQRAVDRTTLAAGALLGAGVTAGAGALWGALRSLTGRRRRS